MRKWIRRLWVTAGIGSIVWLFWNAQARGVDPALLHSTRAVAVSDSGGVLRFTPQAPTAVPGLIFLPGATIEPEAYAPLLRAVADRGHAVALVRLPWRMAASRSSRATVWDRIDRIRQESPARPWILAGHSRGAALAAQFAGEHPEAMAGLVLIATTHPKEHSLATLAIPVTKIYGTQDCVADSAATLGNAALLPSGTRWVRIEGANHRQFGWMAVNSVTAVPASPEWRRQHGRSRNFFQPWPRSAARVHNRRRETCGEVLGRYKQQE